MSELEQELLELGGDSASLLDDVLMPAVLLDRDGTIRWQNKASIALRGRVVGANIAEFVAPDERPDARVALARILCRGEPAEFTLVVIDADGGATPIQFSAVPVRRGETVVGIFGLRRKAVIRKSLSATASHLGLTERQVEVLLLLADGRSTDEIASELSLSATTVRNHVANLISALGVHSR